MKTFEYRKFGLENLVLTDRSEPRASARQVVVKFHAASLNYRDVMFFKGIYKPDAKFPAVPLSDGAGEVVEIGENVHALESWGPRLSDFHARLARGSAHAGGSADRAGWRRFGWRLA